ncbi:MAG: MmcQ/YjbR family DNA-binding protein [Candidatus Acidiferrum sp.]|jgi:predicted DNA-binding protein (MmcQ/YjbR family)
MNIDQLRAFCLSFPGVTEHEIWHNDLTFKVANKMFAHSVLEVAPVWLSFKTSHENFALLIERQGVVPAPYLARAQWVALETREAIPPGELSILLREAYDLVVAKLPKKTQATLAQGRKPKPIKKKKRTKSTKPKSKTKQKIKR